MDSSKFSKNAKLDELNDIKYILENKTDNDIIFGKLKQLDEMEITYDDLFVTKIGKTINNLTKSKDNRIKDISNKLLNLWKRIVKNKSSSSDNLHTKPESKEKSKHSEKISQSNTGSNVRDQKGKSSGAGSFNENNKRIMESLNSQNDIPLRNSARKLIYESLLNTNELMLEELINLKKITYGLENLLFESLYDKNDPKAAKYFNRVKAIVSNLKNKNNLEFKEKIINGEISLSNLVDMDVKDMASSEMQSKRKQAEDEGFKSRRSDWNSIHSSQLIGIYNCEQCKSQKTSSFQMQIRGADEPMTTFITCLDCGNQWKLN